MGCIVAMFGAITRAVAAVSAAVIVGCSAPSPPPDSPEPVGHGEAAALALAPDHVVVVVMQNRDPDQIVGAADALYFNSLVGSGALFTNSFAIGRPSQPNLLALFSGDTQGITDNGCPYEFAGPNLGSSLIRAGLTFGGYSEDLPDVGFAGCRTGLYVRKHSPWASWPALPATVHQPFSSFATDYAALPTVAFVTPNICNGTQECSVSVGDSWLRTHLDPFVEFGRTHNSLLIITWDEGDKASRDNRIATLFIGPMVAPGTYREVIDHYRVLRTIEDMFGLPPAGRGASVVPITGIWVRPAP